MTKSICFKDIYTFIGLTPFSPTDLIRPSDLQTFTRSRFDFAGSPFDCNFDSDLN